MGCEDNWNIHYQFKINIKKLFFFIQIQLPSLLYVFQKIQNYIFVCFRIIVGNQWKKIFAHKKQMLGSKEELNTNFKSIQNSNWCYNQDSRF